MTIVSEYLVDRISIYIWDVRMVTIDDIRLHLCYSFRNLMSQRIIRRAME